MREKIKWEGRLLHLVFNYKLHKHPPKMHISLSLPCPFLPQLLFRLPAFISFINFSFIHPIISFQPSTSRPILPSLPYHFLLVHASLHYPLSTSLSRLTSFFVCHLFFPWSPFLSFIPLPFLSSLSVPHASALSSLTYAFLPHFLLRLPVTFSLITCPFSSYFSSLPYDSLLLLHFPPSLPLSFTPSTFSLFTDSFLSHIFFPLSLLPFPSSPNLTFISCLLFHLLPFPPFEYSSRDQYFLPVFLFLLAQYTLLAHSFVPPLIACSIFLQ